MEVFARRIKNLREKNNMTQNELGSLIHPGANTPGVNISQYETSTHEPPMVVMSKIASTFDVPLCYFYCNDENLASFIIDYHRLDAESKKTLNNFFDCFIKNN
ncbi:helix-turn-helix domain-containing protein [Photobacterium sanguinicancri]|uniref:helix-turn-helix domain-containing protein n=1 Tax=Photobacterium TaxID=657 RepID=UPI0026E1CD22|nr:helix-turn-helix transcriptional regulator [Photobacterium sanguinicancri]MDO6500452.1 helix-turn-helix transcriptional regulator [Photobacterium sanguinicancri]